MSFHRPALIGSVFWGALCIGFISLMTVTMRGQDESRNDEDDTRERLVLFKNGRMLEGRVSRNGGGYLIEQTNGSVQVSTDDVKFIVNDLPEAYRKQRDSIVEPTPATHVALANWCISHKLYDEAREELRRCLKRDPDNEEARRLLQRLTDTFRANLPPQVVEPIPQKTSDGFQQNEAESLGALSKEMASLYTSRIQPLLLNKCANASCHGTTSSNDFRLTMNRNGVGGSRQITERNLAQVLRQIDMNEVASSRLLRVAKGAHGGKGPIFVGPAGSEQIKQLREWTMSVAREKTQAERELEHRPTVVEKSRSKVPLSKVTQVSGRLSDVVDQDKMMNHERDLEERTEEEIPSIPRKLKPDQTDAAALAVEPIDAFDPEDFNRRFRR